MEKNFSFTQEKVSETPESKVLGAIEYAEKKYKEDPQKMFESSKLEMRRLAHEALKEKDTDDIEGLVLSLSPEPHDSQMEELVSILREKGLKYALKVLYKLNNYHLEDDFHRFLVQYLKAGYGSKEIKQKSRIAVVLQKTLYEVSLPQKSEDNRTLKEVISGMEQFYAGMLASRDRSLKENVAVSFEMALPHVGEELSFYVAVPDTKRSLFEKQLLSIFPGAKIREVNDDYNIFNAGGVTVGSTAHFKKSEALSLKTYEEFDHDPLNVILNSFSKLQKEGEGAAIQIIFAPKDDFYQKRYVRALDRIGKGVSMKEALDFDDSLFHGFGKVAKDIFSSSKKDDKEKKLSTEDESALQSIRKKIISPIVSSNLRLVASASDKIRAEAILSEMEATFNQFEDTSGNALKFERMRRGALSKFLRKFSYREFSSTENLPVSLRELSSIFHFAELTAKSSGNIRQSKANTAPAPADIPSEGILLGLNKHRNEEREIFYAAEDRLRHFYCIGQTGTGKTTLLKNMIIQDIKNGEGVCMIDPHGSDIEDILATIPENRWEDVIYFDPGNTERPMALNMLEYDERFPEQKTFVVNEMLSIFNKLFDMKVAGGPAFEQYFRNSALLVLEHPESGNTLMEIGRVLSDKKFRDMKLSHTNNPTIKQFWANAERTTGDQALSNFVPYITNKFDVFITNDIMRPIVAQERSAFNFREIMDNRKILLVNLAKGRLGDINSSLLGLILVGKILMAALSRVDSIGKDMPPFYLYIDEFQNVTTNSITSILSEARKYKLSLNIAHQYIAQLEEGIKNSVFGNVGSLAVFRVGADDAEYLEKQFAPIFTANDLLNVDNRNSFVKLLSYGRPIRPFSMETVAPEKGNPAQSPILKQLSARKYGKPRQEIEEVILSKYGLA